MFEDDMVFNHIDIVEKAEGLIFLMNSVGLRGNESKKRRE